MDVTTAEQFYAACAAAASLVVGLVILRLLIRRWLPGAHGQVWIGRFRRQTVAVKCLSFPAQQREQARRVVQECQNAEAIRHPNIVASLHHTTVDVRLLQRGLLRDRAACEALPAGAAEQAQQQLGCRQQAHQPEQHREEPGAYLPWEPANSWQQSGSVAAAQLAAGPAQHSAALSWLPHALRQVLPSAGSATLAGSGTAGVQVLSGSALSAPLLGSSSGDRLMTFLVMELCRGGTLQEAIQRGVFRAGKGGIHKDRVLRTALDLARGLAHLHDSCQLVHRDVSTSNVLLAPASSDPRGFRAKLSDFGLSVALERLQTSGTTASGTVAFMPPDVLSSDASAVTPALDVYSFGIVVYCMCCDGQHPYPGQSPFQIVSSKLEESGHQRPLPLPPGVPPRLQQLIRGCTHWDPQQRRERACWCTPALGRSGASDDESNALLPPLTRSAQESGRRWPDVACPRELHSALADAAVTDIRLLPSGRWNFSREGWPGRVVLTRAVTLVGVADDGGRPPYVDVNRLTKLVVVGANGSFLQSNLFLDDCLVPAMPLLCLAVGADNGNLTMHQLVIGDASCTDIGQSTATDWLLKSAYWATWQARWARVDERSIHVVDTGEIAGMPQGVRWRIVNSTFRCTGNETHALPGAGGHGGARGQPDDRPLASALMASLLAAAAAVYYLNNRNVVTVSQEESPEVAVARSKGIVLQALIGQGAFGRVFRAQWRGRVVAVKIIELPAFERKVAGEVTRECQRAMACSHPCIAATLAFFTVTVRTHLRRSQLMARLLREGYAHANHLLQGHEVQQAQRDGSQGSTALLDPPGQQAAATGLPPDHDAAAVAGPPAAAAESAGPAAAAPPGSAPPGSGSSGSSGSSSSGGTMEGVMTLLVMEYCSLGNLHRAIAAGRFFLDRRARLPNLDWAARTALDVARGLAHLHDSCQLVHRDVSTNNVLLSADPGDPRGFRAKLSDFGLTTLLRDQQTHNTSQLKGTTDFMPPEIFTVGQVRFAVDIYSLGIALFWMCTGESPYAGLAPFQVVGRKLEEVHKQARLAMPSTVPASLQQLLWDCTHWDPRARPRACEVADRLQALLAAGWEQRAMEHPAKAASA
ncbi:hypothetical protein ABPG75_006142 [Micractinium tetrahymenae]